MIDRPSLRMAGAMLFIGELSLILVTLLHPGREAANDHPAVFAEYAASDNWTAVHLGQFVATAVILDGLLALVTALDPDAPGPRWVARFAAGAAVGALALTAVLQAVDGVALKQAIDAWARAPAAERASTFANAEVVRWLEWGVRSYQRFMLGLTFLLVGIAIAWTGVLPKPVGYLAVLVSLAYLVQGWLLGTSGFAAAASVPTPIGLVLELGWAGWVAIIAWRLPGRGTSPRPTSTFPGGPA
ncbi:MAG TPA: hypothetical protein VII06_18245 [Chloroflexota bacterium]|jgi:hypothetical protein